VGTGRWEIQEEGEAVSRWTFYFSTGEIRGTTKGGVQIHAVPTAKHSLYVTSDPAIADYLNGHKDAVLVEYRTDASPQSYRKKVKVK
jgi:hypothetical protein